MPSRARLTLQERGKMSEGRNEGEVRERNKGGVSKRNEGK